MTEATQTPAYVTVPVSALASDPRHKSPLFASLLSAMPGLGQVYVGYYQRGFVHAVVVGSLITFLSGQETVFTPLAGLFLAFFWLYNIVDAGRRAVLYNEALAGRSGIELPEDFKAPAIGGSIAGGLAVMAVGGILLANTLFDVPLDWIADWWPAALILFGMYLVGRSVFSGSPAKPAA